MRYLQHIERYVGGMKILEIPGRSDGVSFFCIHGYGANCYDLAGLVDHLDLPAGTRCFFPDGILRIDLGYPSYEGRAWFPIDWEEIERIRREGGMRDLSASEPPGMGEARDALVTALEKLECEPEKTIIGGFSQGAMLATDIALAHGGYFAGLLVFSGTLVNRAVWEKRAFTKFKAAKRTLRFHQSHGRWDPILPFQAAERLHSLLVENGCIGMLQAFDGQHEIPPEVITSTNQWLKSLWQ